MCWGGHELGRADLVAPKEISDANGLAVYRALGRDAVIDFSILRVLEGVHEAARFGADQVPEEGGRRGYFSAGTSAGVIRSTQRVGLRIRDAID